MKQRAGPEIKEPKLDDHGPEIIGGFLMLAISALLPFIDVSPDVAWFAGIMSVLLSLSVAATKRYIATVLYGFMQDHRERGGRAARIGMILSEIGGEDFQHARGVVDSMLSKLEKIHRRVIPLDAARYFHFLMQSMRNAPRGTQVLAVNTIDERRWSKDPREVKYFRENLKALNRGVKITRIFVLNRRRFYTENPLERIEILKKQTGCQGLSLGFVWKDTLQGWGDNLRDQTFFDQPSPVLYTGHANPDDPTRVSHGEMVMNQHDIDVFRSDFPILSQDAMACEDFINEVESEVDKERSDS